MLPSLSPARLNRPDPLAYLPCSSITQYRAGESIYAHHEPSTRIYLVVAGRVKIARAGRAGDVLIDVYQSDEFFGEAALAGPVERRESASALEKTKVMSWSWAEISENAVLHPALAIGLLQIMVDRVVEFGSRIQSFSMDSVPLRLQHMLIRFALRFGKPAEDGGLQMAAFTHELLSQYVGTSREIVTHHMSRLRREGYLDYSRDGISLSQHALREWQLPKEETLSY